MTRFEEKLRARDVWYEYDALSIDERDAVVEVVEATRHALEQRLTKCAGDDEVRAALARLDGAA